MEAFEGLRSKLLPDAGHSLDLDLLLIVCWRRFESKDISFEAMRMVDVSGDPAGSLDLALLETVSFRRFESSGRTAEALRGLGTSGIPMKDKSLECLRSGEGEFDRVSILYKIERSIDSLDLRLLLAVSCKRFESADISFEALRRELARLSFDAERSLDLALLEMVSFKRFESGGS
jgi:hypothetical protein